MQLTVRDVINVPEALPPQNRRWRILPAQGLREPYTVPIFIITVLVNIIIIIITLLIIVIILIIKYYYYIIYIVIYRTGDIG